MRKVENSCGLSCTAASPITDSTPRPSGASRSRSAVSNSGSPKKTSPPWSSSPISSRRMTPAVAVDSPPSSLRSALPSSLSRWLMTARRSLRSSSGRPALSAKWKTRPRLDSCVSLSPRTLRQQHGPEGGHGRAHRHARSRARPELRNSAGKPVGVHVGGRLLGPRADPLAVGPRRTHAGDVALDVGQEHRDARGRQLLGDELQRLGLAGAGGAGDQAVPVEHRQRHPHPGPGVGPCRPPPPRPARAPAPRTRTPAPDAARAVLLRLIDGPYRSRPT